MNKISIEGLRYLRRTVWDTSKRTEDTYGIELSFEEVLHKFRVTEIKPYAVTIAMHTPNSDIDLVLDIWRPTLNFGGEVWLTKDAEPKFIRI